MCSRADTLSESPLIEHVKGRQMILAALCVAVCQSGGELGLRQLDFRLIEPVLHHAVGF